MRAEERRVRVAGAWEAERRHADIVLGYDKPESGQAPLEVAADLARRTSAHLHVVHGIDLSDYPIDPDAGDWEATAQQHLAAGRVAIEDALAGHLNGWSYHAAHGRPLDLLTSVAEECDALLIVVGLRQGGFFDSLGRLVGGSVSHHLVNHSRRPVLVVGHAPASQRHDR